jgi:hypothetical protein
MREPKILLNIILIRFKHFICLFKKKIIITKLFGKKKADREF